MAMKTEISDFHKMIISFKIFYKIQKPKIIHYRNYETFNDNLFKGNSVSSGNANSYAKNENKQLNN